MRWAELIISISWPIGKLGNSFSMNVNVIFCPPWSRCFADIIERMMQEEIINVKS